MQETHLEVALKFLADWHAQQDVIGSMLTGSYSTGLQTDRSDIDIFILLDPKARYWVRGNIRHRSGYIIEYAAYSPEHIHRLQQLDIQEGQRLRTRMLATGIILHDKLGQLALLQTKAKRLLKEAMPPLDPKEHELNKYFLWDQLDNVIDLAERNAQGVNYSYYAALQKLLHTYAAHLRLEIPRPNRVFSFLSDPEFCNKYDIEQIPDTWFKNTFLKAMEGFNIDLLQSLTEHVQKEMGGFDIDGWRLYGQIE